ncbi:hypothetical protein EVG20_g10894 [Dentipellis fragilis]|uniref:Uncharacterized protein n=1 Tax=Dentipellis fragilis TaxID=205917 RepID=A0A4Y9XT04_9AGAM|nr:hypothetical protein EVG20_g10894 [Dentipellis fragilis]
MCMGQIYHLSLSADNWAPVGALLEVMQQISMPQLEHLDVQSRNTTFPSIEDYPPGAWTMLTQPLALCDSASSPALKSLSLLGTNVDWSACTMNKLERLELGFIDDEFKPNVSELLDLLDSNMNTLKVVSLYGIFVVLLAWDDESDAEELVEGVGEQCLCILQPDRDPHRQIADPAFEGQHLQDDHENASGGDGTSDYADVSDGGSISGDNYSSSADDGPNDSDAYEEDDLDIIDNHYSSTSSEHEENVIDEVDPPAKASSNFSDSGYGSNHAILLSGAETEEEAPGPAQSGAEEVTQSDEDSEDDDEQLVDPHQAEEEEEENEEGLADIDADVEDFRVVDLPEVEELRLGFWHAQELIYILKHIRAPSLKRLHLCNLQNLIGNHGEEVDPQFINIALRELMWGDDHSLPLGQLEELTLRGIHYNSRQSLAQMLIDECVALKKLAVEDSHPAFYGPFDNYTGPGSLIGAPHAPLEHMRIRTTALTPVIEDLIMCAKKMRVAGKQQIRIRTLVIEYEYLNEYQQSHSLDTYRAMLEESGVADSIVLREVEPVASLPLSVPMHEKLEGWVDEFGTGF